VYSVKLDPVGERVAVGVKTGDIYLLKVDTLEPVGYIV